MLCPTPCCRGAHDAIPVLIFITTPVQRRAFELFGVSYRLGYT